MTQLKSTKVIEKLNSLGLIYFSTNLTCIEKNGEYKKIIEFPNSWKIITESQYNSKKNAVLVKTGLVSNCFVIDIDDMTKPEAKYLYDNCCDNCKFVVKTRKGYHFYYKYDEDLALTKTFKIYGFDLRGNGGVIISPPSKYMLPNNEVSHYTFVKMDKLIEIPQDIKCYMKYLLANAIPKEPEKNKPDSDNSKQRDFIRKINNTLFPMKMPTDNKTILMRKILNFINPERGDDYSEWIKIGLCLFNSGYEMALWDYYSSKSNFYDPISNQKYYESIYNNTKIYNLKQIKESTLWWYLKIDNPDKFKEIKRLKILAELKNMNVDEIQEMETFCNMAESEIADYFFMNKNMDLIKINNNNIYYWEKVDKLWLQDTNEILVNLLIKFYAKIVEKLHKSIDRANPDHQIFIKNLLKYKKITYMRTLYVYVAKKIKKTNLNKIDDAKHIISFQNGIYDLKENIFRDRIKEDYIATTLNYAYKSEIDDKIIKDIREKIFNISNCDEKLFEFNLAWLGYCMTGETELQSFLMMIGYTAANGKSTLGMMFSSSLPIYSTIFDSQTFDKKYEKAHKQLAEVTKLIRFVILEEMSTSKLNVRLFKTFTAGGKQTCEKLFGTKLDLDVRAKLYCTSNVDPVFVSDEGFRRRGILEILENKFVQPSEHKRAKNKTKLFIKDTKMTSNFDKSEYQLAFVQLLLPYACGYYVKGLVVPQELKGKFGELCDDNDIFKSFIDEFVTYDPNSFVGRKEFVEKFNKEMNKNYTDNFITRNVKQYCTYNRDKRVDDMRGAYMGIKLNAEPVKKHEFDNENESDNEYEQEVVENIDHDKEDSKNILKCMGNDCIINNNIDFPNTTIDANINCNEKRLMIAFD